MDLMDKFSNLPWNPIIHGYLTIDRKAAKLIGIIDSFNTFKEIKNDLELLNPSLYQLSIKQPVTKGVTYRIVGHGFLKKVSYELKN